VIARRRLLLVLLLVPAAAVVTAWVISDLSEAGAPLTDRELDPLPLSPRAGAALGICATFVLVAGIAATASALRAGGRSRRIALTVMPSVGGAMFLALGYRIFTAAVHGANIGAGMWLMAGFVVVPSLIWLSFWIYRSNDPGPDGEADPCAVDP
jgi:hypothetical protein